MDRRSTDDALSEQIFLAHQDRRVCHIMPRDARTELQWTWVVPIPKQSIQHLALRDATRHNSIPRPSRRLSAISTEGETAGDLDSLGEAELTRPGVEGPVEDAMAGEA